MSNIIGPFRGKWAKLGNYSPCLIFFQGHAYQSVEAAYQAAKTTTEVDRKKVSEQPTPAMAKKMARSLPIRSDWEEVKIPVMLELLRDKFAQEPERSILLATQGSVLMELNWWNDQFWGADINTHEGANHLGRLLMQVRGELLDS